MQYLEQYPISTIRGALHALAAEKEDLGLSSSFLLGLGACAGSTSSVVFRGIAVGIALGIALSIALVLL